MEKLYEKKGDSFLITHNQKEFIVKMKDGEFLIKQCVCDNIQEFIFFINALTDIAEELTMSPEELTQIIKEREKKRLKVEQKTKVKQQRTLIKMTSGETLKKRKLDYEKRKAKIEALTPEEKAEVLKKRREYMKEYKERKQQEGKWANHKKRIGKKNIFQFLLNRFLEQDIKLYEEVENK